MGVSLRKLARILDRAASGLHRLEQTGAIKREPDGLFDVNKVRRAIAENTNRLLARPATRARRPSIPNHPRPKTDGE
jgi:hypothetical protein